MYWSLWLYCYDLMALDVLLNVLTKVILKLNAKYDINYGWLIFQLVFKLRIYIPEHDFGRNLN